MERILKKMDKFFYTCDFKNENFSISLNLHSEDDCSSFGSFIEKNIKNLSFNDINTPIKVKNIINFLYKKFFLLYPDIGEVSLLLVVDLKDKYIVASQGDYKIYKINFFERNEENLQSIKLIAGHNKYRFFTNRAGIFLPAIYEINKEVEGNKNDRVYYLALNLYFSHSVQLEDIVSLISLVENKDISEMANQISDVLNSDVEFDDMFFMLLMN